MPQHFAEPTPHAGLGALGANVVPIQINGREGRIDLQRLRQGLEAATDRLVSCSRALPLKSRLLETCG